MTAVAALPVPQGDGIVAPARRVAPRRGPGTHCGMSRSSHAGDGGTARRFIHPRHAGDAERAEGGSR